jgi:phosphoribosylglycinamide formyltransferase 2
VAPTYLNIDLAMMVPDIQVRLFGKPAISGVRRMGVVAVSAESIEEARKLARQAADTISIKGVASS